jgi:hypothetical protein
MIQVDSLRQIVNSLSVFLLDKRCSPPLAVGSGGVGWHDGPFGEAGAQGSGVKPLTTNDPRIVLAGNGRRKRMGADVRK